MTKKTPEPVAAQTNQPREEERFWESINQKTGDDILTMVMDFDNHRINAGKLMDRIAARCVAIRAALISSSSESPTDRISEPAGAPPAQDISREETGKTWRVTINRFSKSADIRTEVRDGDEIIASDLSHYDADRIVTAHNKSHL